MRRQSETTTALWITLPPHFKSIARFAGSTIVRVVDLGLTPQALC